MQRISLTTCLILATVFLAASGFAQSPPPVSFAPLVNYAVNYCPISMAVADFNGDGKPDLVTADCNGLGDDVSVLLGNGDGTFQAAVNYNVPYSAVCSTYQYDCRSWDVAVGDFNGDGKPDLLVVSQSYGGQSGSLTVLLGNGDGTFQPGVSVDSGSDTNPIAVAVADFNGDKIPDLVIANACNYVNNCTAGLVGVLLGNGDGTFQEPVNYSAGPYANPYNLTTADVNGDKKQDLVVASQSSVSVLLGNGDGTFQTATNYNAQPWSAIYFAAVGDLNGDGKPDLVVTNSQVNTVGVLLGNGDGTFQAQVPYPVGNYPFSVAIADFNGDGIPDLAVANLEDSVVDVLLGNGDGTFQAALPYSLGSSSACPYNCEAYAILAADFNGDTQPDIAVAVASPSNVAIFLNNTRFVTTTALISSANPSLGGQSVVFTATVSSIKAGATGSVTFQDGANVLGTVALSNGVAALATSSLVVGSHNITAIYSGDTLHVGGTSNVVTQAVNLVPTSTKVTSSLSPSIYGQSVTFTASVAGSIGTPTGTITFEDGGNSLGSISINGGPAILITSALAAGPHSISAVYSGDATHQTSTSLPVSQTVNQAASATTLSTSQSPSLFGGAVTFTATVNPQYWGVATGSVVFLDGSNAIGAAELAGNFATFSTSSLQTGTHKISAVYGGDGNFIFSSSAPLTEVVQGATATAILSSQNPSTFGQPVTFTAMVTSNGGTPTGKITFKNGATVIGTPTLANGSASVTTSSLAAGSPTLTATYAGANNFLASSASLVQTVGSAATTTTITNSSANPSTYGQAVTFAATVTGSGGAPTGTVTFKNGTAALGKATLSSGVASFTTGANQLQGGALQIIAVYGGDKNHPASTSVGFAQNVNKAETTTQLAATPGTIIARQTVNLTVTVGAAPGIPTGTVTFTDGTKALGKATLNGGSASVNTNAITGAGLHTITATYQGTGNYLSSIGTATVTVQ